MATVSFARMEQGTTIHIDSDLGPGRLLNGDKEESEAALKEMAEFILDCNPHHPNGTALRNLKIAPLSQSEIGFGIEFIKKNPFIRIVDNDLNRDEGNFIRVTRVVNIRVIDHTKSIISDDGVAIEIGSIESLNGKVLFVSQRAWNILNSYYDSFNNRQVEYRIFRPFTLTLTPRQIEQERRDYRRSCAKKIAGWVGFIWISNRDDKTL